MRRIVDVRDNGRTFDIYYQEDDSSHAFDFDSYEFSDDWVLDHITERAAIFKRKPYYDKRGRLDTGSQDARERHVVDAYNHREVIYV